MKRLLLTLAAGALLSGAAEAAGEWFTRDQYGLFVHWGCYSVPARGEWYLNGSQMDPAKYAAFGDAFRADKFDARAWAACIKRWGMRYIVFTTRHHDGYAMWNSKVNPFNCMKTGPKRDILGELVPALREAGIRVGYYYSPANWSNPDYAGYRVRGWPRGANPWKDEAARKRFVAYYKAELAELLEAYGPPDYLWWDGCLPHGLEGDTLLRELRKKYPAMIWNDRMGQPCDVRSCEQEIRATAGSRWEACMTLNHNWGYVEGDDAWKSPQAVVDMYLKCVTAGGNLLLNVGPKPDGTIPQGAVRVLDEVGRLIARPGLHDAMMLYPASVASEGDTRGIRRILDKAERGEEVNIAVMGGSVTAGTAASSESNRWGDVFADGWRALFPKAKVNYLNAGIGATGATIGAFRYGRDVSPFKPDLLVLEFAVNDQDSRETERMTEAIVRHAQRQGASVLMVELTRKDGSNAQKSHLPVARRYGVPVISYRDAVMPRLRDGTWTWDELAADGVHPRDKGHRLIGELLNVYVMESWRKYREERSTKPTVPEPAITHPYEKATMMPFAEVKGLKAQGFGPYAENRWGKGLVSKAVGDKVAFTVYGGAIGLIYKKGRAFKGTVKVAVDGVECRERLSGFADIGWWWTPAEIVFEGKRADHTVEIEVTDARDGNAAFALCSLLVDP